MKRFYIYLCSFVLVFYSVLPTAKVYAAPAMPEVPAPSVILIDRSSGKVLAEKNADEKLYPASVTKIMTLLLTIEAIDNGHASLEDTLTISRSAMSMGGSTACLGEGERYTVHEMIKAVAIQSANDGAVALAEFIAGSEDSFVSMMNNRAKELGMTNTNFMNCHGLDEENHYTTARDIAYMSRELLSHPLIKNYSTIWMDSLRDGTFLLSATNKLIKTYNGITGLKTGSTSKAGSCISASAERDGMEIIAVILHASSSDDRYESARKLLDYGFANYQGMAVYPQDALIPIPVLLGKEKLIQPIMESEKRFVIEKTRAKSITRVVTMAENVQAPVVKGQKLGELTLYDGDKVLAQVDLVAASDVERLTFGHVFARLFKLLIMAG